MSVHSLLDKAETSDEHLEANLCIILQSVRGTKQYWFLRKIELRCMIREWGSPTLLQLATVSTVYALRSHWNSLIANLLQ